MSQSAASRSVHATPHERRVARRLFARGEEGLAEALIRMRGVVCGQRYEITQLYAIGAEGAVFDVVDRDDPDAAPLVAKLALHPVHRPFQLDGDEIRRRRYGIRVESQYLLGNSSPFMPRGVGLFEVGNPLLDVARGDAFGEPEPVIVMEKLPGHDLDRWLARTHRSGTDQLTMRRTLDRIAVVLIQALTDLRQRGVYFADLRPGNMRMMGRPDRRVRMMDAGSLVSIHDKSGRFPHVPAYLPPEMFHAHQEGERIIPSDAVQAVMTGRTLFECATGRVPVPGRPVDLDLLFDCNVSKPVAQIIRRLCVGKYTDVRQALAHLVAKAKRRVVGGNDPRSTDQGATADSAHDTTELQPIESGDHSASAGAMRAQIAASRAAAQRRENENDAILPEPSPRRGFVSRLLGRFFGS